MVKYCNENVCVCVCLSVCELSPEPHARSLHIFVHVAYRRGSILLRRGDAIPRKGVIWGVFFPFDNALYSTAFGTHTKTAELIQIPFGLMSLVGPRYHVLHWAPDPPRGRAILAGKRTGPL